MTSNRKTLLSRGYLEQIASSHPKALATLQTPQHANKNLEVEMGLWGFPKALQDWGAGSQTRSWVQIEPAQQRSRAVLRPKPCLSCAAPGLLAQTAFRKADWNLGFLVFFWNTNESIRQQGGGSSVGVEHLLLGNCAATPS